MEKIKMELYSAIDNHDWKETRDILDRKRESFQQLLTENCDFQDKLFNLLSRAISQGAPADIISQLISPHNINMQKIEGYTVLTVAIKKKRWELVQVLMQHGAEVNLCDSIDILHSAISQGAPVDIITQLISSHNINVHAKNFVTALHWAVLVKRWELVPVLLQHGADVNIDHDENGYFHASEGHPLLSDAINHCAPTNIITQLISPHNINKCGPLILTALHAAVKMKRWKLVPILLQRGADVNLGCEYSRTPLHLAAQFGAPADTITWLISPHNINVQDKGGNTPLYDAVRWKMWKLVPVLLQHGADPSMLDSAQPVEPLLLSLQALCIATIRSHMPVKSDEAYVGLALPKKLVAEVKLRPQAEDIVNRGRCQ